MSIKHNFTYHPVKTTQITTYEQIRAIGLSMAQFLDENIPDSREKSVALTKLEEAVMWANAAVARNS